MGEQRGQGEHPLRLGRSEPSEKRIADRQRHEKAEGNRHHDDQARQGDDAAITQEQGQLQ